MHAQEAIDSANRRLTVVLNALRAIGQLLWEPKTVAQALELVQGNITVAMMKYAVNLFALDALACKRIKVYGKATTLDFIGFSAFTQHISVPGLELPLTEQDTFIIVRCLRSWYTLIENSEEYKEDDGEMIQLDVEAANLPSSPTIEAHYSNNWKIMATLKKRILAI